MTISGNYFSRLDGNVIMLSGYTRNITIYRNEFEWIGDNVIGYVVFCQFALTHFFFTKI